MENNNDHSSMKDQAKKGLSTFVLTLSISLIVFSTIYYLMTTKSSEPEESSSPISVVVANDSEAEPDDPCADHPGGGAGGEIGGGAGGGIGGGAGGSGPAGDGSPVCPPSAETT